MTRKMKMETEICVVTLNCWGIRFISKDRVQRMNAIGDELATGKYDFVFLQEIWTTEDYERIKKRTSDVLPYSYYFYSGVIGAGICIFSKSEIKSAFFHQWAVNGYIHKVQHGDWFGGKGIGMVEVVHNGLTINLYTAHLHAEYDRVNDEYLAHRVIQAFDTAQFIKMTSKHADAVIVGGDLNTEPGDLAYKVIIHTAELKDSICDVEKPSLAESLNTNEIPSNSYSSSAQLKTNPFGKRIDYICFKSKYGVSVKTISSEVPWPNRVPNESFSYSDHEAVVAKLRITKSTSVDKIDVPEGQNDAKKEVILESINICSAAMEHLQFSKKMYFVISLVCLCCLLALGSFDTTGNWWVLLPILRILTLLVLVFGVIMGSVWNRMEVNGILAGMLAMKLEIGRSAEFDDFDELGACGDRAVTVSPIDCAP
ncbi:putative neutral sphingomyelinase [Folsomia candida]|uniref:sphingomyelin phosphodiesterase n=1 Tax=Folsomia candida TaxID=158441 RepID=A0A226E771_FOLCA|nr:putative neutral sphingomyelinase [Folsomia candida]XP_035709007.1 putative neutral sphingomyelinase [Folsomia candida]OXA52817.1 putative neutral sphingomyelinase [Folsomia candida]